MPDHDIVSDMVARLNGVVAGDVLSRFEADVRRYWAGQTVYVKGANRQCRNMEIIAMYRNGKGVDDLASRFGLTTRRIRQIINRKK